MALPLPDHLVQALLLLVVQVPVRVLALHLPARQALLPQVAVMPVPAQMEMVVLQHHLVLAAVPVSVAVLTSPIPQQTQPVQLPLVPVLPDQPHWAMLLQTAQVMALDRPLPRQPVEVLLLLVVVRAVVALLLLPDLAVA